LTSARDQQIRAVYLAALERPPDERASFVAQLSGTDDDLKRSVERLLSGQDATEVGGNISRNDADIGDLAVGTHVGQYRIEGVLGRGGMGVVYGATDTKLHRSVAIKFLATSMADANARRRFEQEAKTTSALNHPHIVTVYDVGEHVGQQYIVSELVDGGTLDSWSSAARRSWRQCVELLTGAADALAAAHLAGVLHRDVKPGNILIGTNGYAKLADFGLAKLVYPGSRSDAKPRTTREGVVVGTVAYMSPEQATGQPLDARSDVFSFGIVLYELLAGKRPFESANDLEVLKSIAHAAPPPLPDSVPEMLRIVVDKALEKEPGDRYQTMRDLVADLKRVARRASSSSAATPPANPQRQHLPWFVAVACALALVLAVLAPLYTRESPPVLRAMHLEINAPGYLRSPMLSRDGTQLAYVGLTDGVPQIWTRPINGSEAKPIPGTEGGRGPFWSPDGRSLAFYRDADLLRINVSGGGPQWLASGSPAPMGGAWRGDGSILFPSMTPTTEVAIGQVPAAGGSVTHVTVPGSANGDVMPRLLPDGKHFIYLSGRPAATEATIKLASFDGSAAQPLFTITETAALGRGNRSVNLEYANGYILYFRDETLMAQPFDAQALTMSGEPQMLLNGVSEFSITDDLLVYRTSSDTRASATASQVNWYDRAGIFLGIVQLPYDFTFPVLSTDGRHVAVSAPGPDSPWSDIWTIDLERGITQRQTSHELRDVAPVWSPDGARIAFASARDGGGGIPSSIYERTVNAFAEQKLFSARSTEFTMPNDWSRNNIIFTRSEGEKYAFWVLPLADDRPPYPLVEFSYPVGPARFSPDGRWIAYAANESDGFQIIVQPFPNVDSKKIQISTRGGLNPRWRADGRELYYLGRDGAIMAVEVEVVDGTLNVGAPRALFATRIRFPLPTENAEHYFDVAPDGQKFLLNDGAPESPQPDPDAPTAETLHVVVNWASTLRD